MDVENGFPYEDIEDDLGEIVSHSQFCKDIYLITAVDPDTGLPNEYYVFPKDTDVLSPAAKAYGAPLPNHPELMTVSLGYTGSGSKVIHYEGLRYRLRNKIKLPEDDDDIRAVAVYGMEENPEYFGKYPAPIETPYGAMLRYKEIVHGILALETELGNRMIAIAYPLWADDLSDFASQYGLPLTLNLEQGIHRTYGYLFFSEETACLPLLELSRALAYPPDRIDMAALKNAVFQQFPEYMIQYNQNELAGQNDGQGVIYQLLGINAAGTGKKENLIAWTLDAGTEYLKM